MNLKGKKILITGGAGFIGTNLQRKLKVYNAHFEVFDKSNGQNIENEKQVASFVKKKFDVIFHLAGISGSVESNLNPQKSFKINAFATVDLCEQIAKYSPKTKLIISSSRLEYGNPQYLPVDEKHPTIPTSAYGLSKLAATQMALIYSQKSFAYNKNSGLDVVIFRTSNVYGPHETNQFPGYNVINYFIDLALKNKTLTVYGDGKQKRDYIYVDDLTEAFILVATSTKSSGQIYNLGFGSGIEFRRMVQLIIRIAKGGKIKFSKWPGDFEEVETGSYISDISKIKKDLNFVPKTSFEAGIQKSIIHNP